MNDAPSEVLVVGAGLAGACAALHLSATRRVLLLETHHPAAGASGAAAGLANPLMGRRARAVWRCDEALDALAHTLTLAHLAPPTPTGLLRPAANTRQARIFRDAADARPDLAAWLSPDETHNRAPDMAAAHGALWVHRAYALDVPALVRAMLDAATRRGAEVRTGVRVTGWEETPDGAAVTTDRGERYEAQTVVLAPGYGYRHLPELAALNLHAVKGQVVRTGLPTGHPWADLPPLSGHGYVVPDADALVVGSSYERDFSDTLPSEAQTRAILARAAKMLPGVDRLPVRDTVAGVRINVPGTRLPMLGPLPGRSRVWVFTGLGSKGLLMAPLLARDLPAYLAKPDDIPPEIRVALKPTC